MPPTTAALWVAWGGALLSYAEVKPFGGWHAF